MAIQAAPENLTDSQLERLWELTCLADKEFVPPLSARNGTLQKDLLDTSLADRPVAYFKEMCKQDFYFALDSDGNIAGFMSYRKNYSPDEQVAPGFYVSTVFVSPEFRGRGMVKEMYRAIIAAAEACGQTVLTRTWTGNAAHTKVLADFGFAEAKRIKDARGVGVDTVYYQRG